MTALLIATLLPLVYAFFGYPLLLALLARQSAFLSAPPETAPVGMPSVTMLLSVYNEEAVIESKLANFLALDYPREKLSLVIVSDGSTDETEALINKSMLSEAGAANETPPRITLLRQEGRLGKTSALNLAAETARGDILLFTDADAMLRPDSVKMLTQPFADPQTGLASGRSVYLDAHQRETESSLYRRYEEWIKAYEGRLFGIAGADGALYALRRELYAPLPPEYINDLLHPVQAILAGKKAVAVHNAVAVEPRSGTEDAMEFARQTRIMAQSWLICLRFCLPLYKAGRYGFLWQLVSHKTIRWMALPLLSLALGLAATQSGPLANLTLAGLGLLTFAALLGAKERGGKAGRIAWLFMLQSAAALNGLARLARGHQFITWSPRGQ